MPRNLIYLYCALCTSILYYKRKSLIKFKLNLNLLLHASKEKLCENPEEIYSAFSDSNWVICCRKGYHVVFRIGRHEKIRLEPVPLREKDST